MFIHDGVLIAISVITGVFAVKAARVGNKINNKVGNGFTDHVYSDLRIIMNDQAAIKKDQAELLGKFEQHVEEHEKWSRNVETRIPDQRKILD